MKRYSKNPRAVFRREKYNSNEEYRQICMKASRKWKKKNRIRFNTILRKRYADLPKLVKEKRLRKVRKMRKLGLWLQ